MTLSTVLAVCALVGAIFLVFRADVRVWAIVAAITAGIQVAMALRLVQFGIRGLSLNLVFGAILVATGLIMFFKLSDRIAVASATTITLVGAIQVLQALSIV